MKYVPFHPKHALELGSDRAEIFYEFLRDCVKNPHIKKDSNGYFVMSYQQIQNKLGYGRTIQKSVREILKNKNWIKYRLNKKKPPTIEFKVCG